MLALLFIQYISDKFAGHPYASVKIPEGASVKDMLALTGNSHIGEYINTKIIAPLEKASNLRIKADFNKSELLSKSHQQYTASRTGIASIRQQACHRGVIDSVELRRHFPP